MTAAPLHRLPRPSRRATGAALAATLLTAAALVPAIPSSPARAEANDHHPAELGLVFADEFDGTSLDRSRWCTRYQYGGGAALQTGFADAACTPSGAGTLDFLNDEQQRYRDVNSAGERLHVVRDGFVALRATRTRNDGYASFESAMLRSKKEFVPAAGERLYLTARVRLPDVKGTWPAFWLAPGVRDGKAQWPPEIDILEGPLNRVEDRDTMLHLAAHGRAAGTTTSRSSAYDSNGNFVSPTSLRGRWLEVGLEWTDTSACWYVDGQRILCRRSAWLDDAGSRANPSPILLNLAIGGQWAGRHGIENDRFPASFDIDHVRVYSSKAAPGPAPVPPPAPTPAPTPSPAPPAPAPPAPAPASGVLRGDGSGLCLTQHESGRSATIETCGGAVWTLTASGRLKTPGGRCLTAFGDATANGSRVGAATCTGSSSQRWRARSDGTLVGTASGRCLDVRDAARTPGARVQLWDCHAGSNQRWRLA